MKVTILINSKPQERNIPVCWEDVLFWQFLLLEKCGQDIIKVLSLFTGVDYETLRQAKIINLEQVIAVLGFLNTKLIPTVPKTILKYPVPSNLEIEQVQQYIDLKNYIIEANKLTPTEQLEKYALYCAVYACAAPNAYGKYSWEHAEKMQAEFLNAPCTEVMGIGNFTLLKLAGLNLATGKTSRKADSAVMRLRLVLAGWRIRMVLFLRSLTWRKRLV